MWSTYRRYEWDINRLRIPKTMAEGALRSDDSLAENAWGGAAALGSASKRFEVYAQAKKLTPTVSGVPATPFSHDRLGGDPPSL